MSGWAGWICLWIKARHGGEGSPRVRRVISQTRVLNLLSACGATRRSFPSFEMLKPRNLCATALLASLTFSGSFRVRNRRGNSSRARVVKLMGDGALGFWKALREV